MPRLIPRLLRALSKFPENTTKPATHGPPQRHRISAPKSGVSRTNVSHHGRKRSILLDHVNPITDGLAYRRRKAREPGVLTGLCTDNSAELQHEEGSTHERQRVMSTEERRWWANPYLRMISSPMRRCIVTNSLQPADFMVRVAAMSAPRQNSGNDVVAFFPDGVEHPRYRGKRAGMGRWVVCHKDAVEHIVQSKPLQKRYLGSLLSTDSLLTQHVGQVLRARLIQELELLGERLRCKPLLSRKVPVLRRLRRAELQQIKQDGVISLEGAVAVIIMPPPNKDPVSKERPEPSSSPSPTASASEDSMRVNKYPIAQLYPQRRDPDSWSEDNSLTPLTGANVPLYNGVALFPHSSQRAAFYRALQGVMHIERRARHRQPPQTTAQSVTGDGDQRGSHAYVLYSTPDTLERTDSVPLAIALWRLRMWEGEGWNDDQNGAGIYVRNPPWFDRNAEPGRPMVEST